MRPTSLSKRLKLQLTGVITFIYVDELVKDVGFKPTTPIDQGIHHFVQWYREYYK